MSEPLRGRLEEIQWSIMVERRLDNVDWEADWSFP